MPEQDLPPGLTDRYYVATPAPLTRPAPTTPAPTPPTPSPTPSQFRDTSTSFTDRMARNQLPVSTPVLDRAAALTERAQAGIKNLVGEAPPPTATPTPTQNVLANRTGVLEKTVLPIPIPTQTLPMIKPGAQPNVLFAPKPNTTPAVVPTADTKDSILDARYARKDSGY
jgi:hypothetical protein